MDLGLALVRRGEPAAGLTHLRRAVDLQPTSAAARYNLGQVLEGQNELAEAVDCYRAAARLQPDSPEYRQRLAAAERRLQAGRPFP